VVVVVIESSCGGGRGFVVSATAIHWECLRKGVVDRDERALLVLFYSPEKRSFCIVEHVCYELRLGYVGSVGSLFGDTSITSRRQSINWPIAGAKLY